MNNFKKNWLRNLLQWGTIVAIVGFLLKIFGNETVDPEAYCPFGGVQTFVTYLERGSMACSMTATQIMVGIVLAVCVMLFSKLFCGYLCPVGLGTELMSKLRKKLKVKAVKISYGSVADKALRSLKYVLLFWIFYMTVNDSELFCKNFDPYYAFATGFQGELTPWMAAISISVLVLCSFFVDMFWCKYICPLGGLSNIFKFAISFAVAVGLYSVLVVSGVAIPWEILLGALCLIGFIGEIFFGESKYFPLFKIQRDEQSCNNCGLCSKKCPYKLDVANMKTVKHVDCTLCGECVSSCKKGALTVSGKKSLRWAPGVLVVVLFFLAILLGSKFEIPTIDVMWGDEANQTELSEVRVDGLRSVKCYGSSMAFAGKLKSIPGVYGVETYVKHSYVIIKFNPAQISEDKLLEQIYVPTKFKINAPAADVEQVKVITIRTENMHDKMDPNYLGMQFRNSGRKYYGLETEYACPIIVRLYADMSEPIDEDFYRDMVERKVVEMPAHGGEVNPIEVDYLFEGVEPEVDTISRVEFLRELFNPYKVRYSKNCEKWEGKSDVMTYELIYPTLDKPIVGNYVPYLSSYMSITEGVLAFETLVNDNGEYAMRFTLAKEATNAEEFWKVLTAPKWKVVMSATQEIVEQDPKFGFDQEGKIIE